ncbi:DUF2530 domain-containing protein [Sphaerisporangium flaviroseum]|uniref:DUF2530 domain-containing protein n=1 Tax=Sphaerisporangium flaviroseum TaxID=509199 RepID=UPI0031E663EE
MNEPRPPDPSAPLETNDTATILAGTGLWVVALIVLLIMGPSPDHRWWIWTCVAGIGLGLFGCLYVRRRDRSINGGKPSSVGDEKDESVPGRTLS